MGQVSAALGGGLSFDFKGRAYRLAPWQFGPVIARYEEHVERRAWAALRRLKGMQADDGSPLYPAHEVAAQEDRLRTAIANGDMSFGQPDVMAGLFSPHNLPELLYLQMAAVDGQHVTRELAKEMCVEDGDRMAKLAIDANPRKGAPAGGEPAAPANG